MRFISDSFLPAHSGERAEGHFDLVAPLRKRNIVKVRDAVLLPHFAETGIVERTFSARDTFPAIGSAVAATYFFPPAT